MPTNTKVLQKLFSLESDINNIGEVTARSMTDVFMKLNDGGYATDEDWGAILLQVSLTRRILDQIEKHILKAREEPVLYWRYNE